MTGSRACKKQITERVVTNTNAAKGDFQTSASNKGGEAGRREAHRRKLRTDVRLQDV